MLCLTYCLSVVEKESEDEQLCITVYTINKNICDADPLDTSSNIAQSSKHCLT